MVERRLLKFSTEGRAVVFSFSLADLLMVSLMVDDLRKEALWDLVATTGR